MIMFDDDKPRSIRFPEKLWNAIDVDAKRCKRSAVKQMEAVLTAYYGLDEVNISLDGLDRAKLTINGYDADSPRVNVNEKPDTKKKSGS